MAGALLGSDESGFRIRGRENYRPPRIVLPGLPLLNRWYRSGRSTGRLIRSPTHHRRRAGQIFTNRVFRAGQPPRTLNEKKKKKIVARRVNDYEAVPEPHRFPEPALGAVCLCPWPPGRPGGREWSARSRQSVPAEITLNWKQWPRLGQRARPAPATVSRPVVSPTSRTPCRPCRGGMRLDGRIDPRPRIPCPFFRWSVVCARAGPCRNLSVPIPPTYAMAQEAGPGPAVSRKRSQALPTSGVVGPPRSDKPHSPVRHIMPLAVRSGRRVHLPTLLLAPGQLTYTWGDSATFSRR